jgi:SAM-dependent methyltransferase
MQPHQEALKQAHRGRTAAEVYDADFVPALFRRWGEVVAREGRIGPGDRVLDVACGTGVLAMAAHARLEGQGEVVGLDPNEEMLDVARRKGPQVTWRCGSAEAIPFPDASFDVVVSQFGLMFFEDGVAGLREMVRVLRPGGRLAVAVWDAIDHSPGYAVLAELLHRRFGVEVAQAFRAPFSCGDRALLERLCTEAGLPGVTIARHEGAARFPSPEALVRTEHACVWTLGGVLDDGQFEQLRQDAPESLRPFQTAEGAVEVSMPALIVTLQLP